MCSQFAGWQFKNMSRVLRSVFSCDSAAVASYPHQENEEGRRAARGLPCSTVWNLVALEMGSPFKDGPLSGPPGQWWQEALLAVLGAFRGGALT